MNSTVIPAAKKRAKDAVSAVTAKAESTPGRAVKSAAKPSPMPVKATNQSILKSVVPHAAKPVTKPSRPASGKPATGRMSSNKTAVELTATIDQTVVLKVREVATKTTKPSPAIVTEGSLLTEAQILKMSEKDYMNDAQLAFFKARLQQLEKDLLKNADETTEHLRETVLVPDPADRATIEEEHALELRTRDRERKLLKKVQQSIASIDAGDYGWCEETGEPIGIPRLLARPTATLSLEAQQRRELKQKLYGD